MSENRELEVRLHGDIIGSLVRLPNDQVIFAFNAAYIDNPARPTLSQSFKDIAGNLITESKPAQTRLPPFFSNLLPEGALREYLADQADVDPAREFFLMQALGRDLPGALQILPASGDERVRSGVVHGRAGNRSPARNAHTFRFSLAGVQLKFSAVQQAAGSLTIPAQGVGGDWIIKLPSTRFARVPHNEFAMMELARRTGVDVPETRLMPADEIAGLPDAVVSMDEKVFAIRRFDRSGDGGAVHIEDFAQVFGVYPHRKYEKASYGNLARVIYAETGESGIQEFTRRLVFNALIGNADMHLKNWSLIYPDRRRAALAPAYDFVSTIAYLPDDRMALSLAGSKAFSSLSLEQFRRFAGKAELPMKLIMDTVKETVARFAIAWGEAGIEGLDEQLRRKIDAHLGNVPLWAELLT